LTLTDRQTGRQTDSGQRQVGRQAGRQTGTVRPFHRSSEVGSSKATGHTGGTFGQRLSPPLLRVRDAQSVNLEVCLSGTSVLWTAALTAASPRARRPGDGQSVCLWHGAQVTANFQFMPLPAAAFGDASDRSFRTCPRWAALAPEQGVLDPGGCVDVRLSIEVCVGRGIRQIDRRSCARAGRPPSNR
jgi:hypothetical protein